MLSASKVFVVPSHTYRFCRDSTEGWKKWLHVWRTRLDAPSAPTRRSASASGAASVTGVWKASFTPRSSARARRISRNVSRAMPEKPLPRTVWRSPRCTVATSSHVSEAARIAA